MLLDKLCRARVVTGCQRVGDSFVSQSVSFKPVAGGQMQTNNHVGVSTQVQAMAQQVSKEMVKAKPDAFIVQGDQEKVGVAQVLQEVIGGQLLHFRGHDGRAQGRTEARQDRCVE